LKIARIIARVILGLIALVVLLIATTFVVNRNDRPPSAAASKFEQLLDSRPQVPAPENAVVYVLGFNAPGSIDPVEIGAKRMEWIESFRDNEPQGADPGADFTTFVHSASADLNRLQEACTGDERQDCAREFRAVSRTWTPDERDELALHRYRELLSRRAWRDVTPLSLSAPLGPYGDVIHAQRLYYLRLVQRALAGDVDAVRTGLDADFEYWRAAQVQAENLIAKMIAVAALRHHFFNATLVMAEMPVESAERAIPPGWEREFADEERSMWLVMAGEYAVTKQLVHLTSTGRYPSDDDPEEHTALREWLRIRMLGLLKVQATANFYADRYVRLSHAFAVAMTAYSRADESYRASLRAEKRSWWLYNPWIELFRRGDDGTSYMGYPYRVASVEGMRRGALLTMRLRAARVTPDRVPSALAETPLRDPFTGKPFEWNAATHSITLNAPFDHSWRRIEYIY
jgi:hypothetical protein